MRRLLLFLVLVFLSVIARAEPFEIQDGDRVLFLGDTLLEREGTYGYLETRMVEQFPDRRFTVRNLAFSADTPLGWSRASFDPAAKGFERLKEQLALVRPTVVFLGYGMAASLQEMTDRAQDWTLNRDPARYGAEPMSAARFKKELAQCMDAIAGSAGVPPADSGVPAGIKTESDPSAFSAGKTGAARVGDGSSASTPKTAGGTPALQSPVRFVLLSPIRHEDLRDTRPGLPDPTAHNKLLEQYTKAIEELAQERGARFVSLAEIIAGKPEESATGETKKMHNKLLESKAGDALIKNLTVVHKALNFDVTIRMTDNGIHLSEAGYQFAERRVAITLGWQEKGPQEEPVDNDRSEALRAAIIRKNALFFHRWRPANETYLFGFRKREQGQNAKEMPMFDPLIEAAEAEIERLKKDPSAKPAPVAAAPQPAPFVSQPHPSFTLADGLEISLWAENPLLAKPTQMNWDAQGRLWVASSAMYPQIAPGQTAFDKILVIEDTNGDGKAEKSTVFADGLLIPTGVAPVLTPEGHWACYVGQSTELLYFEDTDGDGKADKKRIVFSGFGTEDTHHIVHTLRWGPDGRLYFSQSVYIHTHMETPWGVVRLNSGGTFAYDPRTERVEVVQRGLWNTWGHAWDQWGQSFHTDGAGSTGLSWAFPGATFAPFEGARRTMASISPGSYPKFAGLEIVHSPHFPADWQGTAVTCDFRAHKIVHFKINELGNPQAGNPQIPQISADGKNAGGATSPPSDNLRQSAQSADNSSLKSGYTTEQLPVLVQTSDATFRPIDVKLGPDGALYIADWSNPIINHGEVDFRDPRRDHEHGRIWRLSMKGGKPLNWESPLGHSVSTGVFYRDSDNLWERHHWNFLLSKTEENDEDRKLATLPLAERPKTATIRGYDWYEDPALFYKNYKESRDGHFLPVIPMTNLDRDLVFEMRNLARNPSIESASLILDAAVNAPKDDPFYDFAAWLSVNDLAPQVAEWVEKNSADTAANTDAPDAGRHASGRAGFQPAVPGILPGTSGVERPPNPATPPANHPARAPVGNGRKPTPDAPGRIPGAAGNIPALPVATAPAAETPNGASAAARDAKTVFALESLPPDTTGPLLSKILTTRGIPRDGSGPWIELIGKAGDKAALQMLFERVAESGFDHERPKGPMPRAKDRFDEAAGVRALNALAEAARLRNLRPGGPLAHAAVLIRSDYTAIRTAAARLAGLWKLPEAAPLLETLAKQVDAAQRAAAFEGLRSLGGEPAIAVLQKLVRSDYAPVPPAAIEVLAQLQPAAALAEIPAVLGAIQSEPELLATWRGIFQSKGAVEQLSANFPANLPKPIVAAALRAARELGRPGQRLVAKLTPLAGEAAASTVLADYADLATRAKKDGDPVAGEAIYRRTASACTTCHAIGGAGGKLGPDMTSIGASAPADYIIESILNPAAKVKEGYHAFTFAMKDGTEAIGIPSRETATEQFIRTLAGEQGLPKANIVSKKIAEGGASGSSLMPMGLTAAWADRERLNLYAFLMELGRPGPFDASKNNVARVWMLTDSGPTDGALKVEAAASIPSTPSIPAYTLVDGRLTKDLLAEKLAMLAPKKTTVHLTVVFQAASAGKAKLNLTGIRKAWLDGQPLAIASEPSPTVELTVGAHTFTVEVDTKSPPEVLRVESPGVNFLGD